jgi:hypothetical protein
MSAINQRALPQNLAESFNQFQAPQPINFFDAQKFIKEILQHPDASLIGKEIILLANDSLDKAKKDRFLSIFCKTLSFNEKTELAQLALSKIETSYRRKESIRELALALIEIGKIEDADKIALELSDENDKNTVKKARCIKIAHTNFAEALNEAESITDSYKKDEAKFNMIRKLCEEKKYLEAYTTSLSFDTQSHLGFAFYLFSRASPTFSEIADLAKKVISLDEDPSYPPDEQLRPQAMACHYIQQVNGDLKRDFLYGILAKEFNRLLKIENCHRVVDAISTPWLKNQVSTSVI